MTIAAHHRPIADHLVHRFGKRAGGGEVLQDIDALALSKALENPALDFGEVDHRLAGGILHPDDIQPLDVPGGDILGEGQRLGASRLELKPEALRARIAFQGDDAGFAALGGREFPLADHVLLQGRGILRDGRRRADQRAQQRRHRDAEAGPHQRPFAGVSAIGVNGALPANQAFRLSTTS